MSARHASVGMGANPDSPRGRLLNRIELRARDYGVGEIGPSKWIRWGRLLVGAYAAHMVFEHRNRNIRVHDTPAT